jgi:hypothetical protein
MSKEVKRYEVTVLLDASSSYTVEADSVEAAEHAAWEAHDEASPSLCHQCSGSMDLGDAYGMLIYCDGNEVTDTTHDAREIADLRAERDALLAERDRMSTALDEIGGLCRALRQGGPDPMDLEDLSNALEQAVDLAHAALQGAQP